MSTFDDREHAFESKFAHDAEMQFRAEARANRLLGLWAAGLMGKSGAEAETFALQAVKADFEEAGHEDVIRHVVAATGGKTDEATVRAKRVECLLQAKEQLAAEN